MKKPFPTLILATASLAGCGELPEGSNAIDDNVSQQNAALTDSAFTLHNLQTNYCMGVEAGTPTVGTPLVVWRCDRSANQTWTKGPGWASNPAFVRLTNHVAADRCLHSYAINGEIPEIFNCLPDPHEYWQPIYVGNDLTGHECYRFSNVEFPTKVLGVEGGSTQEGKPIMVWTDFNNQFTHPDQFWCIYPP
jgi:hypothetical protein